MTTTAAEYMTITAHGVLCTVAAVEEFVNSMGAPGHWLVNPEWGDLEELVEDVGFSESVDHDELLTELRETIALLVLGLPEKWDRCLAYIDSLAIDEEGLLRPPQCPNCRHWHTLRPLYYFDDDEYFAHCERCGWEARGPPAA